MKKNTWRYHYQNLNDMIYSSWDIEQNIIKLVFWKIKKFAGDIIILHMCTKHHNHIMYGSWDMEWDRHNFLSFWAIFYSFSPLTTWIIKILTLKKNTWRYYHFTHLHHKWQSYDVWFLRYEAWQTEFFVILDHFLPFYSPNNWKNQNFEKIKKSAWRNYHFTQVYHKWPSYDVSFLRYEAWQTEFLLNLDQFLPFYPS